MLQIWQAESAYWIDIHKLFNYSFFPDNIASLDRCDRILVGDNPWVISGFYFVFLESHLNIRHSNAFAASYDLRDVERNAGSKAYLVIRSIIHFCGYHRYALGGC